jgi:glycosyltransferase involved in cell wall biosynthesis
MRVIAAGTFDPAFSRNRRLHALLQRGGHEVVMCQVNLWGRDRHDVLRQQKAATIRRAVMAYPALVWKFLRTPRGDVVLVQHPGWFDVPVIAVLARLRGMPVLFDMFISLSDTVVSDRKMTSEHSMLAAFCRFIDRLSLRWADRVIADTPAQADFYARLGRIPRARIGVVWVGAEGTVFHPVQGPHVQPRRVLFYGSYIPLHGLPTVVRAAKRLEEDGVMFRIIGNGQERATVDDLIAELRPTNVELVERVALDALPDEIASSAVCLGIFGTSDKARRVVPHKVYECVAVGRPVITGDTEGMHSAFDPKQVAMVEPGNADALAREIQRLLVDPPARETLAAAGHARYGEAFAEGPLTQLLDEEMTRVLEVRRGSRRARRRAGPDGPAATR